MLQLRRDKRDNIGIIFHISLKKVCCDPSLEPSRNRVLMRGHNIYFH